MGARILLALINRAMPEQKQDEHSEQSPEQQDEIEQAGSKARRSPKKSQKKKVFSERYVERAAETEAMTCINSLESGFNFLVALGSLSPLTGFLGTVTGMISAFRSIAEATEVNAQIVAGGIYEALITTVYGLVVAIFAMVFHSVLSHIVDNFAANVEKTCSDLIAEITEQQAQ
jgi:biopolymer transport protein ExbB/TolQ